MSKPKGSAHPRVYIPKKAIAALQEIGSACAHFHPIETDETYVHLAEAEEMAQRREREARGLEANRILSILQPTLTEEQIDALLRAEGVDPDQALKRVDAAIERAWKAARVGGEGELG